MEIILCDEQNMNLATNSLVVIYYLHSYILTKKIIWLESGFKQ